MTHRPSGLGSAVHRGAPSHVHGFQLYAPSMNGLLLSVINVIKLYSWIEAQACVARPGMALGGVWNVDADGGSLVEIRERKKFIWPSEMRLTGAQHHGGGTHSPAVRSTCCVFPPTKSKRERVTSRLKSLQAAATSGWRSTSRKRVSHWSASISSP